MNNNIITQTFFRGALGAWPSPTPGDGVMNGTVFWSFVGVSDASIPKLSIKQLKAPNQVKCTYSHRNLLVIGIYLC